jgi:hypothetical protein
MLTATYLGWQSWLIANEAHALLLDPLFVNEMGRGSPRTRTPMPHGLRRRFVAAEFPAIDAVLLSHEHEDHFNIPSLAGIHRRIPVYLSSRSSSAAHAMVREMGFDLQPLEPGALVDVGTLRVQAFSAACSDLPHEDEWDTLAVHVSDAGGQGNFFTNVDVPVTPQMSRAIARLGRGSQALEVPTLAFSSHLSLWSGERGPGRLPVGERGDGPAPPVDEAEATRRLGDRLAFKPLPGMSIRLAGPGQVSVEGGCRFLEVLPPAPWPPPLDREPVCGERELTGNQRQELEAGLARLAEWLYGGHLFRRLLAVPEMPPGKQAGFALVILAGAEATRTAYAYDPGGCRFAAADEAQATRHLGQVVLWGSDLLALFRGELEPRPVTFRACRESWDPALDGVSFRLQVLWPYFHPLRDPASCLRQYRRAHQAAGGGALAVRPGAFARARGDADR